MGDAWFPTGTPMKSPLWRNAVDNPIVVQFVHRWFAFVAAAALVALALKARGAGASGAAAAVIGLVALQIVLGVATLLSGVRIELAVAHQANAALLLWGLDSALLWGVEKLTGRGA